MWEPIIIPAFIGALVGAIIWAMGEIYYRK